MSQEGPGKHFNLYELLRHDKGRFQEREDTNSPTVTISGLAERGALSSSAVWLLKRTEQIGGESNTTYADDAKFSQVWDDRANSFPPAIFTNDFSINFDGTNDHLLIGDVAELDFSNNSTFSLSAWFKLTAINERIIFSKQAGSNNAGYRMTIHGGNPRFHLSGGAAGDRIEVRSSITGLNDGNWHNIIFVYNGTLNASGVDIYIDSIIDPAPVLTADTLTAATNNAIAAQISGRNGTTATFNGNLDEVSMANVAFGGAAAVIIFNGGTPLDISLIPFFNTINVGWWRMGDNATFPTIPDDGPTSNDGTMTNMDSGDIEADTPP